MGAGSQPEAQDQRATLMLTRAEKDDLRLVSVVDEVTESTLLRDRTVGQIVERADEIRGAMKLAATKGAA